MNKKWTRKLLQAVVAIGAALAGLGPAAVQSWRPDKNVEIIVGLSPGGSFDLTARSMQKIFQDTKLVETPVTVVNRPGGNNSVSWVYMNSHAGDAHYLALVFPTLKEQGYDIVVPNWRGIAGPKGMTRPQVAYWEGVFARLAQNPEWQATLAKYGWENEYMDSARFMKFLEAERKALSAEFAALGLTKQ